MLVLLPADLPPEGLGPLPPSIELQPLTPDGPPSEDLARVEAVVLDPRDRTRLVELLPRLTGLRLVQAMNAGIDWMPPLPEGVLLCRAGGVHDGPVAEWVVAAILAVQKRLPWFLGEQSQQRWDTTANLAFNADAPAADDVGESTVLIVGQGSIGSAVADRLRPFGATVLGVTRSGRDGTARQQDLPRLLPGADVVVLLAPATPETVGMVDAAFLGCMKPGAVLVNAARGALVHTDALVDALRAGRIRAALDTVDPEPLPAGHPLWSCPGVLITPHVAGSSRFWRQRAWSLVGEQLRRWSDRRPLQHVVER